MSTRNAILDLVAAVGREQKIALAPLSDDLVLLESGLDSLCFAILVARLEDKLGYDPFSQSEDVFYPATLGEFIQFYEANGR